MILEESLAELALLELQSDQKRFQMYRYFIFMKHGQLGSRACRKQDNRMQ